MESRSSQREIVVPAATLAALRDAIREHAGGGPALRVLRDAGKAAGDQGFADTMGRTAPGELSESAFWDRFGQYLAKRGWGVLRQSQVHPGVGLIQASDWADAEAGSAFSEGLLSSLLSGVAEAPVATVRVPSPNGETGVAFAFGAPATIEALQLHLVACDDDLAAALEAL